MVTTLNISREKNYSEWLKYRSTKLTSTDAAKLLSKSFNPKKIVENKTKPHNSFTNKYMDFGNKREPHILEQISTFVPLKPNDLIFQHKTHEGFTATPDGISDSYTVEVKTSLYGLEYNLKKYYPQIQWQMFITGKKQSLFIVEQHENFVPQKLFHTFIQYDFFLETIFVERGNQVLEALKSFTPEFSIKNKPVDNIFVEHIPELSKNSLTVEDDVKW